MRHGNIYPKTKIKLSPVIRNGREFVEVTFGNDNDIRLSLSKEENVLLVGGRAYLPAEDFVLAEFFDRYVKMAFIDYSAIKETAPVKRKTNGRHCRKAIWKNFSKCVTVTIP